MELHPETAIIDKGIACEYVYIYTVALRPETTDDSYLRYAMQIINFRPVAGRGRIGPVPIRILIESERFWAAGRLGADRASCHEAFELKINDFGPPAGRGRIGSVSIRILIENE